MGYPETFVLEVEGIGTATCWRAESQEYANCMFSAGLVEGIPPDAIYARVEGKGEPVTLLMRPDEALAFARTIIGALWSADMFVRHPEDVTAPRRSHQRPQERGVAKCDGEGGVQE